LESLEVREETTATVAEPAPQSPSEDELMALFDSYDDQDEDADQDEAVELQNDFEQLFDSEESAPEGADDAEDLMTLEEDLEESEPKEPTR